MTMRLAAATVLVAAAWATPCHAISGNSSFPLYDVVTGANWSYNAKPLGSDVYFGDIRAVLQLKPDALGTMARGQVFWRRRDPNPELKMLVVTTAAGDLVAGVRAEAIEQGCGIFSFDRTSHMAESTFYLYWMPHFESGGGAGTHFHWLNCTQSSPHWCETYTDDTASVDGSACEQVLPASSTDVAVVRLENRPNNPGSKDHTPSGESFHGYTALEFTALASEMQDMLIATGGDDGFRVFMTDRQNHVRIFKPRAGPSSALPAVWARAGGEILSLSDAANAGEYFTFQIGIFTPSAPATNISLEFGPLKQGSSVVAAPFNCFNLGGVDEHGIPFNKTYTVEGNGSVGSMWVGVDLPHDIPDGIWTATMVLRGGGRLHPVTLTLKLSIAGSIADHGDADVYKMSRLRWLDSTIGIDDTVTRPFTPIQLLSRTNNNGARESGASIQAKVVNKIITVGPTGLVSGVTIVADKVRQGKPAPETYSGLSDDGVSLELVGANGEAIPLTIAQAAVVTNHTDSEVSWVSQLTAPGIEVQLTGMLDFTSYVETVFTITGNKPLGDVRVRYSIPKSNARYILGMGLEGSQFLNDVLWRWQNTSGECDFWAGRMEAGVYLKLKGAGTRWDNPQYSKDYPQIPFVPPSWGGVGQQNGLYGVNISAPIASNNSDATVTVFSGPRAVSTVPTEETTFRFDLMFTPSKPLNQSSHWNSRYFQVGYGTPYKTPQEMKDLGATVVTLHQGIPGIINGTMVNPYINWPFVPEVVELLENYTSQAHNLGLRVKYYYTIRELTNHAVELFALKALQGEIVTDEDPYTIPQAGYCHDWDCHGGSFYLHEHVVSDYMQCWQQSLPNGEWDASVCDMGVSRWFNYYVSGLNWSVNNAPHIDGIYYDGINFDRQSFRRIRKLLDSRGAGALIDIHTGEVADSPSSVRYIGHFPFADSVWNGEGFKFQNDKVYWLVDASGIQHGISADRLGGSGLDARGMLFAMYQRNSGTAPAIWNFWDKYDIQSSTMIGWWEDDCPVNVSMTNGPTPPPASYNCTADMLANHISGGYLESSGGVSGSFAFGPLGDQGCGEGTVTRIPPLTAAQAIQECCSLGDGCAGFSIKHTSPPGEQSQGCFKKNVNGGHTHNADYDGYSKSHGHGPSQGCAEDSIVATVYTTYARQSIIVLGSWCNDNVLVNLHVDWSSLGIASPHVFAPAIEGIQHAKDFGNGTQLSVPPSGWILVAQSN